MMSKIIVIGGGNSSNIPKSAIDALTKEGYIVEFKTTTHIIKNVHKECLTLPIQLVTPQHGPPTGRRKKGRQIKW